MHELLEGDGVPGCFWRDDYAAVDLLHIVRQRGRRIGLLTGLSRRAHLISSTGRPFCFNLAYLGVLYPLGDKLTMSSSYRHLVSYVFYAHFVFYLTSIPLQGEEGRG
jgi:hypothetical protein